MSEVDSEKFYKFKKMVRKLSKVRGVGTQLVSLYIPADYPIPEAAKKVREEINQAGNIKSKQTRNNVIAALERINTTLKHFKKTPPKGLVIFSGNTSPEPSKTDIETFVVEPIYTLKQSIYRCDSSFFTEPLEKMTEATDSYGLVAIEGKEATLAILKGTEVVILDRIHNPAHAKVRKGGQSARRYERLVEEATDRYYKKVGEAMDKHFLGKVKGIIVGGPGPAKEYFLKMEPFNYQHKIIGVVDTGYADENGIHEILQKADELLAEQEAIVERQYVQKFITEVARKGKAVYGFKEVADAIKNNRADIVLVSDSLDTTYMRFKCPTDSTEEELLVAERDEKNVRTAGMRCPVDENNMELVEDESLTDYIIELSQDHNIRVIVVSKKTNEGLQFLKGFGGIGAFLRY
ncbi:MAG: peptide chain release factor 1 [Methanobacteriota archaeon]|nr:MAG: peptide chain release factor 1 [Euryarchaeota archaeon]